MPGVIRGRWIEFDPAANSILPRSPGVYVIMFDGVAVYVGQSIDLRDRLKQHAIRYGYGTQYFTPWGRVPYAVKITGKYKLSVRYGDWAMWEIRLINRLSPKFNKALVRRRSAA